MLQLIIIKTPDAVYLTDNIHNKSYFNSNILYHLFDGVKATVTPIEHWYKIPSMPTKVEKIIPEKHVNMRYVLKDGFPETEQTPKMIMTRDIEEYSVPADWYDYRYDIEPESYVSTEFSIIAMDEAKDFQIIKEDFKVEYGLLDRIRTPAPLLPTKPCKLTRKQSYGIIREYVKLHIDSMYAEITSDYDFCFTVQKKIAMVESEKYQVDVNMWSNIFSKRKKKPKYETRYRSHRSIEIFNMSPEGYQNYPLAPEFIGENYNDLQEKVQAYLKELIERINTPYKDCPHCKGLGVVV